MTDYRLMMGEEPPGATLSWLRSTLGPWLIDRLGSDEIRRRLGLYRGDRIPSNERNLTDSRNRVSLIVEYELAAGMNEFLAAGGHDDPRVAYVVANRFPDLETRSASGECGLRFEVKCVEALAEEPSANFDTLLKDIDAERDFLIVCIWEWDAARDSVAWDQAPLVTDIFFLHARSLAIMRDETWLGRPPAAVGSGHQGFDLRFAVTHNDKAGYKEEEGNVGKLLRIWRDGAEPPAHWPKLTSETIAEYVRMCAVHADRGFSAVAVRYLPDLGGEAALSPVIVDGREVGLRCGGAVLVRKDAFDPPLTRDRRAALRASEPFRNAEQVIEVGPKLRCQVWGDDGRVPLGVKPKALLAARL